MRCINKFERSAAFFGLFFIMLLSSSAAWSASVTVSGLVLDEKSEQPVAGAKVELTNANAGTGYYVGQTDADGRFSFDHVRTGVPYDLAIFADGYCPYENQRWDIPSNQESIDLKIPLIRGAKVEGTVLQSDGATPIQNAKVELRFERGDFQMLYNVQSLYTDDQGRFAFEQLPPNIYRITISKGEYINEQIVGIRPQAGDPKDYTVKLYRPSSIEGSIHLLDDNTPLSDMEIMGRGASQETGTSDPTGFFSIENLKPGSYKLFSQPSGFHEYSSTQTIQLEEGQNLDGVTVFLSPMPPDMSVESSRDVYLPEDKITWQVRTFRLAQYESKIFRIPAEAFIEQGIDPEALEEDQDLSPYPIAQQWTQDVDSFRPYRWISKNVEVPEALEPGAYVMQISSPQDGIEDRRLFFVTELGLITKRGEFTTFVYATHLKTGMPVPNTKILVLPRTGNEERRVRRNPNWVESVERAVEQDIPWEGETDDEGILTFQNDSHFNADIIGLSPTGFFAISPSWRSGYIDSGQSKIFIYTDRPVYRPGHTVYYKAIIRNNEPQGYTIPKQEPAYITIRDSQNKVLDTKTIETNDWGSVEGSFEIPANAPLGSYNIQVKSKSTDNMHFFVEEYRKPEYKVTIESDEPYYINGDRMGFTIRAEYYFGAPVINARVNYRIYEAIATTGYYRYVPNSYSRYVSGGSVETDAEGFARVEFTPRRASTDRKITLEADVQEGSGRQVSERFSVPLGVGEFYITAKSGRHTYDRNTPIRINLETRSHDNKPVAQELQVDFLQEVWSPVRKRYVRPSRPFASFTVSTDDTGKASLDWLPDTEISGQIEVAVTGIDKRGNQVTGGTNVWRMASDFGSFDYQYPTLEGILDKDSYQPGETANLLINTQYPEYPIVMTLEGRDFISHRVIWPSAKSTTVEIPVREEYSPNIYVGLFMPRGQRLSTRSYKLSIPIDKGEMKIALTSDREKYKPGETGHVDVKTTDKDGNPVAAEVSVAVVDEAIFAIRPDHTPDIHRVFYDDRPNWVTTSYSFPIQYYGGADKGVKPDIRKDFRDTAKWIADLYTDENGEGSFDVTYPDNLTTWRMTARGHTQNTDVGWSRSETMVTKELVASLSLPRFFTEGDDIYIPSTVHNLSGKNLPEIATQLTVTGGVQLRDDSKKTLRAAAGAQARELWKLSVDASDPQAVFVLETQGEEDHDGLELHAPVQGLGFMESVYQSGILNQSDTSIDLPLDDQVQFERSQFQITYTPSPAAAALAAIPYLKKFPYGCVEQTLNRFLPEIVLVDTLTKLGAITLSEEEQNQLRGRVETGLKRLYSYQSYDGWSWYGSGGQDIYLTSLIVHGYWIAKNLGYPVYDYRLNDGINALKRQAGRLRDWDTQAYVLYVLSLSSQTIPELADELAMNLNSLEPIGLAFAGMALHNMDKQDEAKQVLTALTERLVTVSDNEMAWDVDPNRYWSWNGTAVETTAWGLMALAKLDPDHEAIPQITQWLIHKRIGDHWSSTRATGLAIMALSEVIAQRENETSPIQPVTIKINGATQSVIAEPSAIEPSVISIDPGLFQHGKNEIELIQNDPKGFWSLDAQTFLHGELNYPYKNDDIGFSMSRTFERAIHTKDYRGRPKILAQGIGNDEELPIGQEILVTLTLNAKQDLPYLIVEDPLPSGCEVIESFLQRSEQGWTPYSRSERRDRKMVFFLNSLSKGDTKIEYLIRTELPGTFLANPSHAWGMYYPEVQARSTTGKIHVKKPE